MTTRDQPYIAVEFMALQERDGFRRKIYQTMLRRFMCTSFFFFLFFVMLITIYFIFRRVRRIAISETVRFVECSLSVRLTVWDNSDINGRIFMKFVGFVDFSYICRGNSGFLKI